MFFSSLRKKWGLQLQDTKEDLSISNILPCQKQQRNSLISHNVFEFYGLCRKHNLGANVLVIFLALFGGCHSLESTKTFLSDRLFFSRAAGKKQTGIFQHLTFLLSENPTKGATGVS